MTGIPREVSASMDWSPLTGRRSEGELRKGAPALPEDTTQRRTQCGETPSSHITSVTRDSTPWQQLGSFGGKHPGHTPGLPGNGSYVRSQRHWHSRAKSAYQQAPSGSGLDFGVKVSGVYSRGTVAEIPRPAAAGCTIQGERRAPLTVPLHPGCLGPEAQLNGPVPTGTRTRVLCAGRVRWMPAGNRYIAIGGIANGEDHL